MNEWMNEWNLNNLRKSDSVVSATIIKGEIERKCFFLEEEEQHG